MAAGGSDVRGRSGVVAVVTAYNPDDALVRVCASVREQVDAVVVVDDGSVRGGEVLLACERAGVTVVRHHDNRGVGAALNSGLRAVVDLVQGGATASVMTLDQDSVVPTGYVATLLEAQRKATEAGLEVGLLGPGRASSVRAAATRSGEAFVVSREPIQSGLLVPRRTLDTVGEFDAGLFIDGVDTDYYLRTRAAGLAVLAAPAAVLEHRLGSEHVVRVASLRLRVVHAATFRYYYLTRNRIVLARRHGRREPGWAVTAILRDLRHLLLVSVLVPGRVERLCEVRAGLADGLRGRSGRRPVR